MSTPIAKPYIVTFIATHPRTEERTEHQSQVEAYDLQEAMMAALLELDGKFSFTEQGYTLKVVSIRPDTELAKAQIDGLMKDLQLLFQPAHGGKS